MPGDNPSAAARSGDGWVRAYVGLGANLGDARRALLEAAAALGALPDTAWHGGSSLYRSAPLQAQGPDFLNAVAALDTRLAPHALLGQLLAIERRHGRERPYRNAPRTLDLDLLLHGDAVLDTPDLLLPHPRLHLRAFALAPLSELDPLARIPGHGAAAALLAALPEQTIERLPERLRP